MKYGVTLTLCIAALSACNASSERDEPVAASKGDGGNEPKAAAAPRQPAKAADIPPPHVAPDDPPLPPLKPLAERRIRAEWAKAENRASCGPITFTSDGGAPALYRRAYFGGGWAVAFDLPNMRSAYGVAGAGLTPIDEGDAQAQQDRLRGQWPYFITLPNLPQPAFAGYGVEGANEYPTDNADGRGLKSLAYLRVGGQRCTYNVWSYLGRAHLEVLLDSLRPLK